VSERYWECTLIRAGSLWLDGGGMFGVVPRPVWAKMTPPDTKHRIELQTNCLLLRSEDRCVLVETGCGDKWSDKVRARFGIEDRTVADALREVGVAPEDVTDVVVTHLHFDHAGGLTTRRNDDVVSVFNHAAIHVQRREWEDALANRSTMTGTYLRSHLDPIAGQVNLHEGEAPILPGIRTMPMPGHTWGQQAVLADTAHGTICFPGDVMPTRHHLGAPYSMGYDMLPYQNMLTKRDLLGRACDESWILVLDHEPGHPVFEVERSDDWFTLTERSLS